MATPPAGAEAGVGRNRRGVTVVAFLLLAYPITFILFQGGRFCGPLCFQPTLQGVAAVVGSLAVLAGLAIVATTRYWNPEATTSGSSWRLLRAPPLLAQGVLLAIFGVLVGFLVLDSLTIAEAIWKPIVLPLSFLVFLPVWVLYVATFQLAIVFPILGVESQPAFTLVLRAVVVFIGFPLSVVLQTVVLSRLLRR